MTTSAKLNLIKSANTNEYYEIDSARPTFFCSGLPSGCGWLRDTRPLKNLPTSSLSQIWLYNVPAYNLSLNHGSRFHNVDAHRVIEH